MAPSRASAVREGGGEASVGVVQARLLSREIGEVRGADVLWISGRQHRRSRYRELPADPARSENQGMYEVPHAREPGDPMGAHGIGDGCGPRGEGQGRKPSMHADRKSDGPVIPAKPSNNSSSPEGAETVEGSGPAKGNAASETRSGRRAGESGPSDLDRVREAARRDKEARFTALLHHITLDRLLAAYRAINPKAAPGVDGVTWVAYGRELEVNLRDLHGRLQRGAYRARPARRSSIPKPDGRTRPLAIAALEDKIVQRATVEVLNAIYEQDFLGFSYGFRPGRSPHQALDALAVAITRRKVNWVLDADLREAFTSLDRTWMERFLEHRIADRRILRLVRKWLTAGVIEEGSWAPEKGVGQGTSISPLLANVYFHYAFDLWAHQWRRRHARGEVYVVRFCDDFVVGFERRDDAERFQRELGERLARFGLELNADKTRLIEFGRFAAQNRQRRGLGKPETFQFLGFTHIGAKTKTGRFKLKRVTAKKRMRAKLREVKAELRQRMHLPVPDQGRWLRSVLQGHFNYYAVPDNSEALNTFRRQAVRHWRRSLSRRSQRAYVTWERMDRIAARWLPPARILHPWPEARFAATTRGRSPVS
jgi:RNA-directed DNA polymerase